MGKVFHVINPQPLNAKYVLSFSFLFFFPNGTLIDLGLQIIYLSKENNLVSRQMNILQSVQKEYYFFPGGCFSG